MTHGVIGNTSDFGSEESRFETWWVNKLTFPPVTFIIFLVAGNIAIVLIAWQKTGHSTTPPGRQVKEIYNRKPSEGHV